MKSCICKHCGHAYYSRRIRPFCSNICRSAYKLQNPLTAILIGANPDVPFRH